MADIHSAQTERLTHPASRAEALPAAGVLDWAVAIGGLWLIIGLHLDGWAHHHIQLENFFTPWHAVLYSGYGVSAAAVGLAFLNGLRQQDRLRQRGKASTWLTILPRAYRSSLLGAVMFFVGGLADMTWHTLLGIETSIDALLSPPHLLLAVGGSLLITGPLRAVLERAATERRANRLYSPSLVELLPAILAVIAFIGLLAFFSSYANPWIELTDQGFGGGLLDQRITTNAPLLLAAVLLQSALLSGVVLLLARNLRLPFGTLTLIITITTALAVAIHTNWGLILPALAAGLLADALAQALRPGQTGGHPRLFAFLVPAVLYGLFFGLLKYTGALNWPIQMWTGAILLAGFIGWLVSYGFFPYEAEKAD